MHNTSLYIEEPRFRGYEGIYPFGGEPMSFCKVDYQMYCI